MPSDPSTNLPPLTHRPHDPRDCKEVQTAGFNASGRYAVYPDDGEDPVFVFCDMETDGGGWTVSIKKLALKITFLDLFI